MTIETTTSRVQYDTNGTTGPWTVPFYFLEDGDLLVTYADSDGLETTLVLTTDYTATGAGVPAGGTVTTVSSYVAGGTLTITRNVAALQEVDYVETDSFPAETHETALDRLTMLAQQLIESIRRCIRFPSSYNLDAELPTVSLRAEKLIGLDSDGALTTYDLLDGAAGDAAETAYIAAGTGAVGTDVQSKVRQFTTTVDYGTTAQAIAAAVAGDFVVGVLDDLTVSIPNDAATLQIAVDRLTPLNKQATITLHIATGHALTAGLSISGRDCGQFRITSVDAAVNLAAAFGSTVMAGTNGSTLPRLACLIDASNQTAGNGVSLDNATATIESGCGVRDVYGTGLLMVSNSYAMADGSIWTGAARNGATGAGITSWGSRCSAEGADVSNSGYYGAQAAHGGALSFRDGVANDCYRHGIRATDAAIVDADSASANDCAVDTLGYSVYAYQAGVVNFTSGSATGNLGTAALLAYGAGSAINASEATVTGSTAVGVKVGRGGLISVVSATVSGSGDADYMNDGTGKIVRVAEFDCGAPAETQSLTIAGGDVAFIPHPSGTTIILLSNEAAAASDNLDTVTPATGYTIKQGHRLILATVSGAEDPTIRDVATSGAAGNYAFQTASGTSVTLANTAQLAEFIWRGTFWAMLSYSAN